ncbi:MAG: AlpA family phage regulatory protein [Porticoccaceae bacterium]
MTKIETVTPLKPRSNGRLEILDPDSTLIRIPEVMAITGLGRATVYKRLREDSSFPRPVKLGEAGNRGARVGFVLGEVRQWVRQQVESRDESERNK